MKYSLRDNKEMKDSGVEWINRIPKSWRVLPLRRSIVRNDGGVWGEDGFEGDAAVLRSTDIHQSGELVINDPAMRRLSLIEKKKGRLMPGDLLITKSSGSAKHLGKTAVAPARFEREQFYYSNFMQRLRVNDANEPRYFFYLMNNNVGRQQINYWGVTTSGLVNLNSSLIGKFLFPQPACAEQKRIADFLDEKTKTIDEVVEKKKKQIELLKEKRAALITQAVTKGLDSDVQLKDSGVESIGKTPEGWNIQKLKFVATPREIKREFCKDTDQYIGLENIISKTGKVVFSEESRLPESIVNVYYSGDVLFAKLRPYLAKAFVAASGGVCTGELLVMNPKRDVVLPEFLLYRILADDFIDAVNNSTYGSKMPRANWNFIGNLIVAWPTIGEQEEIVSMLDEATTIIDQTIKKIQKSLKLILEYRSSLISHAVTGKIVV